VILFLFRGLSACVVEQKSDCFTSLLEGDEEFSEWGDWSPCSTTCGDGTRKRSRNCIIIPTYPPAEEPYCTSPTEQVIACYNEPCAGKKDVFGIFIKYLNGPLSYQLKFEKV
jgi:hypothetical protein